MIKGSKILFYWHKVYYAIAAIVILLLKALLSSDEAVNKSDDVQNEDSWESNNPNTPNPHLDWRGRDADHPDYWTDKW